MHPISKCLLALLAPALFFVGCSDDAGVEDDEATATTSNSTTGSSTGGQGGASTSSGMGGMASTSTTGGSGGASVCDRWNADRADLSEGSWSGNVGSCQAGDVDATGRDNALRLVNLYRYLADLPAVSHDAVQNQKAQDCALMMDANNDLSHTPPMNWTCYSADGNEAAGKSNIATTPGVQAVDLYMIDPGNDTTLGHRRWILSNSLGPIGLGTTDNYSCMWVLSGNGNATNAYTAFPPPGDVPIELISPLSFSSVDAVGWSIQSDSIDLNSGAVTITDNGNDRPVSVFVLQPGYGSQTALRIQPQGWESEAGHTYHVSVTGIATPIDYDVSFVACP